MKKPLSVLIVCIMLFSFAAVIPAGAANAEPRYEKKQIKTYLFDEKDPVEWTCLFRSDLPTVPYVCAEDFFNQLFTEKIACKNNGGGSFTFTNGEYTLEIDAQKDRIYSEDPESFTSNNAKPYLDEEKAEYLAEDSEYEIVGEQYPLDLDLGGYGIDITESDGRVYLPFCTLNDVMSNNYRGVLYKDDELTFVETMDEATISGGFVSGKEERTRAFADFTYNELCMTVDNFYGKPSGCLISEEIDKMGLDYTLENYSDTTAYIKKMLLSEDMKDFCTGMTLLDYYFFDGGHSNLSIGLQMAVGYLDAYGASEVIMENIDDDDIRKITKTQLETLARTQAATTFSSVKKDAYSKFDNIKTWNEAELYHAGSTYFFTFDEFKDAVVEPYKWTLDYAKEHGCENFIVDLGTNSGGSVAVAVYMMSFMNDTTLPLEIDETTGTKFRESCVVDKNLDGEFDDKDDLETYDFRFGIITTTSSFSCANLMPCTAQENGIVILGETSGGGACNIAPHFLPDGAIYTLSGSSKIIRSDGTDIDSGAEPDVPLSNYKDEYKDFYDLDRINEGIERFYSGGITGKKDQPESTDAPTENASDSESASENARDEGPMPDDYKNIIPYLIAGAAGLFVILVMTVVIILVAGNKKKKKAVNTADTFTPVNTVNSFDPMNTAEPVNPADTENRTDNFEQ